MIKLKAERDILKKAAAYFAKDRREVWIYREAPGNLGRGLECGALGVSRGGFYAWLTRPRSRRSRSNGEIGARVRASFIASDRTYGARRVWHDILAEGIPCGLHRIE